MTDRYAADIKSWHARAISACAAFHRAEDRFNEAVGRDPAARLAACDELEMACRETEVWTNTDPCPDVILATQLRAIVAAYTEATELERRQIPDFDDERDKRLSVLRATIAAHASAIEVRLEEGSDNSTTTG